MVRESTAEASDAPRPILTLGRVIAALVAALLLAALFLPATRSSREAARRSQCTNNLKQIALAIESYASDKGEYPPAYTQDAQGRRLHSWRTLILPYLEQSKLFDAIDLTKPWDDPANAHVRAVNVDVYTCPSAGVMPGLTTYLGVTGPKSLFSGPIPRKRDEATDDPQTTISVVDVAEDQAVPWMSPSDVSDDELLRIDEDAKSNHPGIFLAASLDGQVRPLSKSVDAGVLRAMLTIDGGEALNDDADTPPAP